MFTQSTKDFGVWRSEHISHKRFPGRSLRIFIIALGIMAFVCWLFVIVAMKIRGDFFLIQSSPLMLHQVDSKDLFFKGSRKSAFSVALVKKDNKLFTVFDDGSSFLFPQSKKEISEYLAERSASFEKFILLSKKVPDFVSRVQIWPEQDVSFSMIQAWLSFLTLEGFDDFDIAVRKAVKDGKSSHKKKQE